MTAATWTLVCMLWAVGPNGWQVDAQLRAGDRVQHALVPTDWLAPSTTNSLWVAFHGDPRWQEAVYLAPDAPEVAWARRFPALAATRTERLLPALTVHRVVLRKDLFVGADGLVTPADMALDTAEIYFRALLEAHLAITLRQDPDWDRHVAQRGRELLGTVPEERRVEAYGEASAEFAAHLLSIAHEVARLHRRKPPGSLCRILDHPATLFGHWRRAFVDGQFRPKWWRPGAVPAEGTWVSSGVDLERGDKDAVVRLLLGVSWSGDPREDFRVLCGDG